MPWLVLRDADGHDLCLFYASQTPMASDGRLCSLPSELVRAIASWLLKPDQVALGRSCKLLHVILVPLTWRDVELHYRGTHEGLNLEDESGDNDVDHDDADDLVYPYKNTPHQPSGRAYMQSAAVVHNLSRRAGALRYQQMKCPNRHGRATDNCKRRNYQFGREELFVSVRRYTTTERWHALAGHVHSLCMSIGVDTDVMETLASLRNLMSLELVGLPLAAGHPTNAPPICLPALRNLRLRGYFPAAFVRAVLGGTRQATHLDLGLLATAADDDSGAYDLRSLPAADEDHDNDKPWAPHSPLWLYPPAANLTPPRTTLTHLRLVRPHLGRTRLWMHDDFRDVPAAYERAQCAQWIGLLRAAAGTLRDLVLEHRVPARSMGDIGFVAEIKRSILPHRRWGSSRGRPDCGDAIFCATVLPFLLEQEDGEERPEENSAHPGRFARLRRLALRGIQIDGLSATATTGPSATSDGGTSRDNKALLHRAFPGCAIEITDQVAYPIHIYAGHEHQGWPKERHEAMQDEADGLLYAAPSFTDYLKRFGPQWRIVN